MGDVLNLRQARKRRDRAAADAKAVQNRARHGLTKAERSRLETEASRAARTIDGSKLDAPVDPTPSASRT